MQKTSSKRRGVNHRGFSRPCPDAPPACMALRSVRHGLDLHVSCWGPEEHLDQWREATAGRA